MSSALSLSAFDLHFLRAALLDGEAARTAHAALRRQIDIDHLNHGHQRLLPLLHRNLVRLNIDDPDKDRLGGLRRYCWTQNQVRSRLAGRVLIRFRDSGIPVALVKGSATIALFPEDASLRPMDDIDILVPFERRAEAIRQLRDLGFVTDTPAMDAAYLVDRYASIAPGVGFTDGARSQIDLHWHVMHHDCSTAADAGFWARSRPARLAGESVSVLSPADNILHAIAHASVWNPMVTLRWVPDTLRFIQGAGSDMRWDVLAQEARARRLAPAVAEAFALLERHFGLKVPADFTRELRRAAGAIGRRELRLRNRSAAQHTRSSRAFIAFMDYRRRSGRLHQAWPGAIAAYVRDRWGAGGLVTGAILAGFYAAGRPPFLRRWLGADTALRPVDIAGLPPLGTPLSLDGPVEARGALRQGWDWTDQRGFWSDAHEARLAWRVDRAYPNGLAGEIEVVPHHGHDGALPVIDIYANNERVAGLRAAPEHHGPQRLAFHLPARLLSPGRPLVLTVVTERLFSPHPREETATLVRNGTGLRSVRFLAAATGA